MVQKGNKIQHADRILEKFQGHLHIAIISCFSVEKAKSVKKAVKQGLTQCIRQTVEILDNCNSSSWSSKGGDNEDKARSGGTKKSHFISRNNTILDSPINHDATS
ncbi:hypothetical protein BJ322DRAFT_1018428 [Thelephora terrestris]|uniref:Uncharacterized protein n=1 Tax=Thelephora terrestris TaxID=56493 RepID=A0A9P6HPI2_9AGAM|nr:hypothetical protein BJ322DRAFT_1018428 [Thelephora terrestris]